MHAESTQIHHARSTFLNYAAGPFFFCFRLWISVCTVGSPGGFAKEHCHSSFGVHFRIGQRSNHRIDAETLIGETWMVYLGASISPWYQSSVPNVPRSRNPNEERKHYNIQGLQYQNISKYIKHPYILYYHYHISSYIIYVPYQMVVQSGYFEENKMPQHWYRGTA